MTQQTPANLIARINRMGADPMPSPLAVDIVDTLVAFNGANPQTEQTGDFTIDATQVGGTVPVNSATQVDIEIPLNATVPIDNGSVIYFEQTGEGFFRLLPVDAGITLIMPQNRNTCSAGLGARVRLEKLDTDKWLLGDRANLAQPILQGFNATALFALGLIRLVPNLANPLAKFRESVGNVDAELGFDSNGVLAGALQHKTTAGSLFLDTCFNQIGDANFNFTQAVDAEQPGFSATGMNGLPCLTGAVTGNLGAENSGVTGLSSPQLNHGIATLWRRDVDTGVDEAIFMADGASNQYIRQRISSDKAQASIANGGGSIIINSVAAAAVGTWYPLIHRVSGGGTETLDMLFDREAEQSDTGVVAGGGMSGNYAMFRDASANNEEFEGSIGAILGFSTRPSLTEAVLIREWMLSMVKRTG